MKAVLVLGGASSGKSMYAQRLAKQLAGDGTLYYLATMAPYDGEDHARIEKHRQERAGWGFATLELPADVGKAAEQVRDSTVLLDSLTSLLTNSMFLPDGSVLEAEESVMVGIMALLKTARNVVMVSDDLFSDGIVYEEGTETFRRQLGHIHQRVAALCGEVVRLEYGVRTVWKGEEIAR